MMNRIKQFIKDAFVVARGWPSSMYQLIHGLWRVSALKEPRITIFGGARLKMEDAYFKDAQQLAQLCVDHNISVLSGGGPGVMQAANCGVIRYKKSKIVRTIGIGVAGIPNESFNECVIKYSVLTRYFYTRKWLLMNYSQGFVFFPGGYGTLDELGEVLTLIQTKKLPQVPVILYDTAFWSPFMDWLRTNVVSEDLITEEELTFITVIDDVHTVFELLKVSCDGAKKRAPKKTPLE